MERKEERSKKVDDTHTSSSLIVVQVHQFSSLFLTCLGERSLLFSDIDEAFREPVSILNVIPASAPDPVLLKGFRSSCSGTTTVGQLSISTGSSNGVNYSGRCDGMSE